MCTLKMTGVTNKLLQTIIKSILECLQEIPRISSKCYCTENSFNMCQFLLLFPNFPPLLDLSKRLTKTKSATKRLSHLSNFCPNIWMRLTLVSPLSYFLFLCITRGQSKTDQNLMELICSLSLLEFSLCSNQLTNEHYDCVRNKGLFIKQDRSIDFC